MYQGESEGQGSLARCVHGVTKSQYDLMTEKQEQLNMCYFVKCVCVCVCIERETESCSTHSQ